MKKIIFLGLFLSSISTGFTAEWSGNFALELRQFQDDPPYINQHNSNLSFSLQPEFYYRQENSRNSFVFEPFLRKDENDDERSHADIRELYWHVVKENWELKTGINKVFWGKTETSHLVDIINQTDGVENIDGEDKLGQAMLNLTLIQNWGFLDFFVLPGFRERNFPDRAGRPILTPLPVSQTDVIYESSEKNRHVDFAARWSHTIGMWDLGVSHFSGTSREPRFDLNAITLNNQGQTELIPIYDQIEQTGVDLQVTREAWLWKAEIMHRAGQAARFTALAAGFEYTFVGIFESSADIGVVVEYLYDGRDKLAPTPFEDDLSIGARLALNDIQSSEALFGIITDIGNQSISYFVEARRRIAHHYKLNIEWRGATNVDVNDLLVLQKHNDLLQIELAYYF